MINIHETIIPMQAKDYFKHKNNLTIPCYGQPKLDGIRCVARMDYFHKVTLTTRNGNIIYGVPHINKVLENIMLPSEIYDGELYNHSLPFEVISGIARRKNSVDEVKALQVQFHLYDCIKVGVIDSKYPFIERYENLKYRIESQEYIKVVETYTIYCEEEIKYYHEICTKNNYEGLILRNNTSYIFGRTNNLLKYKIYQDDEFKIIGYEEGKGKLKNAIGSFICVTRDNKEFNVKLAVTEDRLRELFIVADSLVGKDLTVKFLGYTSYGKPREPIGKEIRWDI